MTHNAFYLLSLHSMKAGSKKNWSLDLNLNTALYVHSILSPFIVHNGQRGNMTKEILRIQRWPC